MNKKTIKFGKTLEKLRRQHLLSQEDLAELSKRDRKNITDLERDEYLPSIETIFRIAVALGMKPSELIMKMERTEENHKYLSDALKEVEEMKVIQKKFKNNPK